VVVIDYLRDYVIKGRGEVWLTPTELLYVLVFVALWVMLCRLWSAVEVRERLPSKVMSLFNDSTLEGDDDSGRVALECQSVNRQMP
jgi:hypothetical protein